MFDLGRAGQIMLYLRLWSGRELRSTPRRAGLMRKLNLPESSVQPSTRSVTPPPDPLQYAALQSK